MKSLGGIGAIILGVVAILVSVGLRTIWAPPAEFNATTEDVQAAPLTVVTDGIDVDPDDPIEYTVTHDGEFTLMYGQLRDIEAWVGDAAHNRIDGVNTDVARGEDPIVEVSFQDGETEVPDPSTSDLWLATQEVTDEVTQRWTNSDAGEWALLIAADGTAPAPADFSVTWVNVEPDSPWITPLLITGIGLIILGIGLLLWRFIEFRRRAKRTSGRRAATRSDYTGLTAADVMADTDTTRETMSLQRVEAGEPVETHTAEQPTEVLGDPETPSAEDEPGSGQNQDQDQDHDQHDDTDDDDANAPPADTGSADEPPQNHDHNDDRDSGFLRRTITGLTALGVVAGLGIGPAHATTTDTDEDIEEQVDEEQVENEVDAQETETFPVVVEPQLERIVDDVVAAVQRGDADLNADELTGRVAGQALRVREDSYRNVSIKEDYAPRDPISADQILASWMTRDAEFPRTVYAVTADDEADEIQLLVLEQEDPRSQYQLVSNAPFTPGAEIPTGSLADDQVTELAADESDGLVMSPNEAIDAVADFLTDPEDDAAVAGNQWIDQIHEYQAELEEQHSELDTDVNITRTVFEDSVHTVRLQDGSALVVGAMNSLESLTPDDGASVTLTDLTREIGEFGTDDVEQQVRVRYREQFALHVPADGEVSLVGYETTLSTVE